MLTNTTTAREQYIMATSYRARLATEGKLDETADVGMAELK